MNLWSIWEYVEVKDRQIFDTKIDKIKKFFIVYWHKYLKKKQKKQHTQAIHCIINLKSEAATSNPRCDFRNEHAFLEVS